jgi:hypothetical protein
MDGIQRPTARKHGRDPGIRKKDANRLTVICLAKRLGLSDLTRDLWLREQESFFQAVRSIPEWTETTVGAKIYAARNKQRWFAELAAFDPVAMVKELRSPLLIIQGGRDVQVCHRMLLCFVRLRFPPVSTSH